MAYGTVKADGILDSNGNTLDVTTVTSEEATTSAKGYMSAADKTKLDAVEDNATADQTGAEIKAAYEAEADTNAYDDAAVAKLAGIEAGAEVNTVTSVNGQTGAVTVNGSTDLSYTASTRELASSTGDNATLPEVVAAGDSGLMTGADKTKLDAIESGATADQTGAEIKAAYEGEADTNAFTDADHTKLDGIEAGAEVNAVDSVAGKTGAVTLAKGDVGLGSVDNTADADKPVSTATQTALDAKADLVGGKLSTSQIPDLAVTEYKGDVADQTAMLAVSGEKGDWVTRQDDGKVYIITGDDPTSASDWAAITYPAAAVQSVAGKTGAVTLAAGDLTDVNTTGVSNGDLLTYNSLNSEFRPVTAQDFASEISAADIYDIEPEWNTTLQHHEVLTWDNNDEVWLNKFVDYADVTNTPSLATVATTGAYGDLSGTPTIPTNNNQLTNGAGYITSADGGDADTVDGLHASSFLRSDANDTINGVLYIGGTTVGGNEGGEVRLTHSPNSTLDGSNIVIDSYVNQIRFFEDGNNLRGAYLQLSDQAGSAGSEILTDASVANTLGFVDDGVITAIAEETPYDEDISGLSNAMAAFASNTELRITNGATSPMDLDTVLGDVVFDGVDVTLYYNNNASSVVITPDYGFTIGNDYYFGFDSPSTEAGTANGQTLSQIKIETTGALKDRISFGNKTEAWSSLNNSPPTSGIILIGGNEVAISNMSAKTYDAGDTVTVSMAKGHGIVVGQYWREKAATADPDSGLISTDERLALKRAQESLTTIESSYASTGGKVSFSPSLTTDGTVTAYYQVLGKQVHIRIEVKMTNGQYLNLSGMDMSTGSPRSNIYLPTDFGAFEGLTVGSYLKTDDTTYPPAITNCTFENLVCKTNNGNNIMNTPANYVSASGDDIVVLECFALLA